MPFVSGGGAKEPARSGVAINCQDKDKDLSTGKPCELEKFGTSPCTGSFLEAVKFGTSSCTGVLSRGIEVRLSIGMRLSIG